MTRNAEELRAAVERRLEAPAERQAAGEAGAAQCAAKRGALQKQLSLIEPLLQI